MREFKDIVNEVRVMNIDDEDSLTFKSAVIIIWMIENNTCNIMRIKKATDYLKKEVQFIIHNLRANGFIKEYLPYFDFTDEETNWMEFILSSMVGAGELVRMLPNGELFDSEEKPLKYDEWEKWNDDDNKIQDIMQEIELRQKERMTTPYQFKK